MRELTEEEVKQLLGDIDLFIKQRIGEVRFTLTVATKDVDSKSTTIQVHTYEGPDFVLLAAHASIQAISQQLGLEEAENYKDEEIH